MSVMLIGIFNMRGKTMITTEQFIKILPNCREPDEWVPLINQYAPEFGIEYNDQLAMFIAQCGHESGQFNITKENLNYSGDRLLQVFSKYFNPINVNDYARKPEAIGNRVYANRMGNGDEQSGDGYRYCGKGLIQLTGKINYQQASKDLYDNDYLIDNPDAAANDKMTSLLTALWFWEQHDLVNVKDIKKTTRIINGGYNGLEERTQLYNKAIEVLGD